jgi:hypothetical protein
LTQKPDEDTMKKGDKSPVSLMNIDAKSPHKRLTKPIQQHISMLFNIIKWGPSIACMAVSL